jgi:hypothetical protein
MREVRKKLSAGFKPAQYIVKVVEDSLYSVIVAVVVSVLLLSIAAEFPADKFHAVLDAVLKDLEYMTAFIREL